jgi:hypothetical protein
VLQAVNNVQLTRLPICHSCFEVERRSGLKRHCPKLTVFVDCANRSATSGKAFPRLLRGPVAGVVAVKYLSPGGRSNRCGLTRRTPVSTLVQSPESRRFGCDPSFCPGAAPDTSETQSLSGLGEGKRDPPACSTGWNTMPDATRRESWPRASGPFSRITGAVRACTGFGCGCVPGRAGKSCRIGVVRDVAR